jgi:flavin-binding protein dodecin
LYHSIIPVVVWWSERSRETVSAGTDSLFRRAADSRIITKRTLAVGVRCMTAVKIIRVMGTSTESWEDAAREAYLEANESVEDIHGMKVKSWTADVDDGDVTQYKATVELTFPVHQER